jgi:hypothetical protein
MLTYETLKTKPKEFLSATGHTVEEFERLLPVFAQVYRAEYESDKTVAGKPRQRKVGGGVKGRLARMADKLLFILVYHKTYPLQTMQGLHFEMSQSQTNEWLHRLLPVLQTALAELGMQPEREASALVESEQVAAEPADWLIDGTERRRQRPQAKAEQAKQYSGKKKAHTAKNLLIVNGQTKRVVYLSQTEPGKTHDKKVADNAGLTYPTGTTLGKDTGFQGYEPAGVATAQPKKSLKALN